jgi:hypothetical protein
MDFWAASNSKCDGNDAVRPGTKDIYVQLVISFALGLSAFTVFCVLSPAPSQLPTPPWLTLSRPVDPATAMAVPVRRSKTPL